MWSEAAKYSADGTNIATERFGVRPRLLTVLLIADGRIMRLGRVENGFPLFAGMAKIKEME